jgi:hypothetical protein
MSKDDFDSNPVIGRIREERERREAAIRAKAEEVWKAMDRNERTAVRFGLFPAEVMAKAEAEMGWPPQQGWQPDPFRDEKHQLTCALLDVAQENGGIRA